MPIAPNEPAFPVTENIGLNGISTRTYIATQVLSSFMGHDNYQYGDIPSTAKHAVELADALIAELDKKGGEQE